jgi:hypothetical protein
MLNSKCTSMARPPYLAELRPVVGVSLSAAEPRLNSGALDSGREGETP